MSGSFKTKNRPSPSSLRKPFARVGQEAGRHELLRITLDR